MVVAPILNNKTIKKILPIKATAYNSFYEIKDGEENVMDNLNKIFEGQVSIENKIIEGYNYLCKTLKR